MSRSDVKAAIIAAATARGVDPAYALAVADRESAFNPAARSSKTIAGIYQMRGDLRAKYGVGDSLDPSDQANGWINSLQDLRSGMRSTLGRDPSDPETYLGHHFGAQRAGRMLNMDPSTPVGAVFTPQEMSLNPHFARAGTVGRLNSSVMADIDARMARFGGAAQGTSNTEPADLSSLGELVQQADRPPEDLSSLGTPVELASSQAPSSNPQPADLSSLGTPVQVANLEQPPTGSDPNMALEERKFSAPEPPQPTPQPARPAPAAPAPPDLSQYGTPVS